jgi:DMSO/TMAO reductase YedYZ molybdopterin-dependent catalytic subunit
LFGLSAPAPAQAEEPAIDVLYEGTVTLTPGETFTVIAYNSSVAYTVYETTPLGALQAAAAAGGFTYDVTDKKYADSGVLLLDNVGSYPYVKGGSKWYAYVNGVHKDGYDSRDQALNLLQLADADRVEFYYAAGIANPDDFEAVKAAATAAVKTVVSVEGAGGGGGGAPADWTLELAGAKETTVTRSFFEQALACSSSGHQVSWTDGDGNVWTGVPLWLLVAMVDDDPDVGTYHFNFNDDLAAQHYEVNVISSDGWTATFDSADIARNNGYIVANTLNGEPLPLQTDSGKPCWPLHLKGSAVFGGQQVGGIVRIELSGLPQPSEGWTLELVGDVGDTITQEEFEEALACQHSGHYREWTDKDGKVWSGVPLWVLLGAVDDIEPGNHWTFNDQRAQAGYTVKVEAADGYSKTFASADVARSDNYIVANKCNGEPLTGSSAPLRLVGPGVTEADGSLGGSAVGGIVRIEIPELQTPAAAPGSWNLSLTGKISDVISQAEFEAGLACPASGHLAEWTDKDGNVWSGMPLWLLAGWVDDRQPHGYNFSQAMAGYKVLVKAGDGYTKEFAGADIAQSNDYILANRCNGQPLSGSAWPLRLVGAGVAREDGSLSGASVGNVVEIELTEFGSALPIPQLHIVKYGPDRTTVIQERTIDYRWMEQNLPVIGDGQKIYRFEGVTFNPNDLWDPEEKCPAGFKISNAVKGTRLSDLCDLVGGMGAGTEVVLVASDGYETRLPYSSVYPDPSVRARQGDAILAWWADGKYVPYYDEGMRLFFTPEDGIYGQWDMHETLPEKYWHYYYSDGIRYPSCAGLSAKWVTEIRVYSVPEGDWTLELDGQGIGGLRYEVSKTYFEQALACQFGANHKATYTDPEGRVWEGMPLWFLAGFVDDADQHSDNAFNDELATGGYRVVITATDGHSVSIDSREIIRNSNYIVANSLDGQPLPDEDWPLRLVGPAVGGQTSIAKIAGISLVPSVPAGAVTLELSRSEASVGETVTASGTAPPDSWVPLKVTDAAGSILVFDATRAGADGSYSIEFVIPPKASGTLTVTVGEGTDVATGSLTVVPAGTVAKPMAWPPGGTVPPGTRVTLKTATQGADIYYTLDGTAPTEASTKYTGSITINPPVTLKAIAVRTGWQDSEVLTVQYSLAEPITGNEVAVERSKKNLAVTEQTQGTVRIAVPDEVKDATISVTGLLKEPDPVSGAVTTGPLPASLNIEVTDTAVSPAPIKVSIPRGTTVSGPAEWNGTINVPRVEPAQSVKVEADPGKKAKVHTVIEVGYEDVPLTFDKAVRLVIPGQAGKEAGYYRGGKFTKIPSLPSGARDDQAWADTNLPSGGDGKMSVGPDLVIWTKHFTKFVTYTQTSISTGGGGDGGGGVPSPAPVTSTTGAANVNPAAGGTISLGDEAAIVIPANALSGSQAVEVKIEKVSAPPAPPAGHRLVGSVYEFTVDGKPTYSFAKKVTITLSFDASALSEGETPSIHRYDEGLGRWVDLGGRVAGNSISVEVEHLSKYAVMVAVRAPQPQASFSDTAGHWAEDSIKELVGLGVIGGYPDGTFRPDNKITRAEFAALLVRAFKLEGQGGKVFADTAGHWAQDAIATAAHHGLVAGYNADTFGPDDPITREQLAAMMVRAARLSPVSAEMSFKDGGSISGWARAAVATAVKSGIIKGYPDNTLRPQGHATRAEAVTVVLKALQK